MLGSGDVRISLVEGLDEDFSSQEYQNELHNFAAALRKAEVPVQVFGVHQASDNIWSHFLIPLAQVAAPALGGILVAWLHARAGRKLRIKVGDIEAEAATTEQIEILLKRAAEFKRNLTSSRESET